jgi:hypothetical protein
MLTRITSLILTLCVGLPMCWCCISAPQQEEVASCCAMKRHAASEQAPAHSQEPNCPCAKHENKREVTATFVQAPAPALKLLAEPLSSPSSPAILTPAVFANHAPRQDHGPPLHAAPLYARHCALLI